MSSAEADGVVDPHGAVHGIDGLHVVGRTPVFPTSGYANPTLTIVALPCVWPRDCPPPDLRVPPGITCNGTRSTVLIETSHGPVPESLDADVCIVGAGPAGLTLAAALDGHGPRVVVLEAGEFAPAPGRSGHHHDDERRAAVPDPPVTRSRCRRQQPALDITTPLGTPYVRLRGSDPLDFEVQRGEGLPGWPLSAHQLHPLLQPGT